MKRPSPEFAPKLVRSLSTAWKPGPAGPWCGPWAWTVALNTLIAGVLTLVAPRGAGFPTYVLISQSIGLTIHALFWAIGHGLKFDMFESPLPIRMAYVASVVLAGSWLGYAAAAWWLHGDWQSLVEHMTKASPWLTAMPLAWAIVTMTLFALVNRLRGRQLARERERSARITAEREAIAARLQLLNVQIEPHFLYNTLAGVAALIPSGAPAARQLIDALVEYLRASSRNMSQPLVALSDELDSVRGYLQVMQMRLGERLRVRYAVPGEAFALRIPPAALQTLVENAIKHGIEPSLRGGEIAISACFADPLWVLEVSDDGVGFGATAGASAAGTGLANLAERLRLVFGERSALTLDAREGGGSVARIAVPAAVPEPGK